MGFGKFIGIVARNPRRIGLKLGPDRQLDKARAVQRRVHHHQRGGMDHVFGIVEHHAAHPLARAQFVFAQRSVKAIEAIGLGRRADPIMNYQPHARITAGPGHCRADSRRIVAITADIDAQFGLGPGGERMGDRGSDHG